MLCVTPSSCNGASSPHRVESLRTLASSRSDEVADPPHLLRVELRGPASRLMAGPDWPLARRGSAPRLSRVLERGTTAPQFDLPDQDGEMVSLESLRGRWALLWWYPKAGTPGCTVEGRELSNRVADFAAASCSIIGLSFDTVRENKVWAENQGFEFRLLSDEYHRVGRLYEVE